MRATHWQSGAWFEVKTDIVLFAQHFDALQECLFNIRLSTPAEDYRLIVVTEESAEPMRQWLGQNSNVVAVAGKDGIGAAAAYNLGARLAETDQVVFMRDYMYVTDGWLERLTRCMAARERAAMVGPVSSGVSGPQNVVFPNDNPAATQCFSESLGAMRTGESKRVPRLLSHLVLIRRSALGKLGGFDERFEPEGYEDDDLSYRALLAGYELYVAADCYVRYERRFGPYADDPGWYQRHIRSNSQKALEKWGFDLPSALYAWKQPITISLCMIVKNEEQTLEQCLSSVQGIADEIVIVDTGSSDKTKEIAGRFTDRIYDFAWIDDFAAARNFAFQQAAMEYILWLDADDSFLPADADKFRELKKALPWNTDAVSMVYNLAFDEYGNVSSSLRRNRLVKRENGFRWIGVVHEYLAVHGNIQSADIAVTHNRKHTQTDRNLNIYGKKEREGTPFSSRDLYYYANELFDHAMWEKSLHYYEQFLERKDGWIEDVINAYGQAGDCLHKLGKLTEAKAKVLQSFAQALPRAENCCRLGYYHMEESNYEGAAFWYKTAASLEKPSSPMALMRHACWTWLPHLQLCVCYSKLGRNDLAKRHNEIAATYLPDDARIRSNRAYFASLEATAQA